MGIVVCCSHIQGEDGAQHLGPQEFTVLAAVHGAPAHQDHLLLAMYEDEEPEYGFARLVRVQKFLRQKLSRYGLSIRSRKHLVSLYELENAQCRQEPFASTSAAAR